MYASEQKISDDTKIIIEFPDDRDENDQPKKTATIFGNIKLFTTIKNGLEAFPESSAEPESFPLQQGTKKSCF